MHFEDGVPAVEEQAGAFGELEPHAVPVSLVQEGEFPGPENVALGGAAKIEGCGVGAALQEASVLQGAGCTGGGEMQGEAVVHW